MDIMAGICLMIQGIWDVRKKEIPLWISLGLGVCSFFYSLCCHREWSSLCWALVPGIVTLAIGYCTRQAVGYGDGILLCALAMLYSFDEIAKICMVAVLLAGLTGVVLFVLFHKSGKYEIPFVPFLFIGWLVLYLEENARGMFL